MKNTQVWWSVGPRSPAWSTLGQMRAGLQEAAEKVVLRKQHRARIQSWGWRDKMKNYMIQLIICRKKYRQLAKVGHQAPAVSGPAGCPGSSLRVNSLRDISERPRPEWREEMKPGSRCGLGVISGLPLWLSWQRIHLQYGRPGFDLWVGKVPWRREWLPTPVFWPGDFHGLYSPCSRKESDMTEVISLLLTEDEGQGQGGAEEWKEWESWDSKTVSRS